ncbi:MAG: hypothetical protein ABIS35_00630 [Terracoccus sp.]
MLETVAPTDDPAECPHVFTPGTLARARASLIEWPSRPADARCAWCGLLVDLRPWAGVDRRMRTAPRTRT